MNCSRSSILAVVAMYAAAIVSCASSSGVMKLGPDTFTASAANSPARGGMPGARHTVILQANDYCTAMGKEILVTNETTARTNDAGAGSANITFQCLSRDDPALQRPQYEKPADTVIEDRRSK